MSRGASGPPARREPPAPRRDVPVQIQQTRITLGPLPAPEELHAYEQVLPGLGERIVAMAEAEGAHRRSNETALVKASIRRGYLGQFFGFTIGVGGMATAAFCAYHQHPTVAAIVAALDIVTLVGLFLGAQRQRGKAPSRPDEAQLKLPNVE